MRSARTQIKNTISKISLLGLIVTSLAFSGMALFSDLVKAQVQEDQITLTAIPPRFGDDNTLLLKPGEKKQVQLRVKNSSPTSLSILSVATDFILDEDGETPIPVNEEVSNRWSLTEWLTMVPQTQDLGAQETGVVNVLIEVPEDALPGGHYAMVTHQPNVGSGQNADGTNSLDSSTGISQRVGTLLYVIVDGPINEEAFIRDFKFAEFSEYGPVPFSYTVENASDIHIQPKTKIEIYDWLGRRVDEMTVGEKNVFPLMSRNFEGEWQQIWGYGRYTAEATMSFGATGQLVIAKTNFWLLPIKLVLAGIAAVLVLVTLLVVMRKRMKSQQTTQQTGSGNPDQSEYEE
jgi:hypothetical protein